MTATIERIDDVIIHDLPEEQIRGEIGLTKKEEDISSLLETEVFKEIKKRIRSGDSNALEVLMAAKEHVKLNLPLYKNMIKLALFAFKPYFLITVISILSQSPTNA